MDRSPVFSVLLFMNMRREKVEDKLTEKKLLRIIKGLFRTDANLDFLLQMESDELEVLVVSTRERLDRSS
jgi:hypothetical protein